MWPFRRKAKAAPAVIVTARPEPITLHGVGYHKHRVRGLKQWFNRYFGTDLDASIDEIAAYVAKHPHARPEVNESIPSRIAEMRRREASIGA